MDLILASSSRYRHDQMQSLQLKFTTASPNIDESSLPHEEPRALTLRLARAKAATIQEKYQNSVVVGSDQIAVCNDQVLTKPGTYAAAREQLKKMRGQSVVFWTSLVVLGPREEIREGVCRTVVRLRHYSEHEIETYLEIDKPFDCAGSFKSESLGLLLFDSVVSDDPSALVGLPLIMLAKYLREFGLNPLERTT